MKALDRKLLRDLASMKGQALAIGAVMASGIAVFVMAMTTLRSLTDAKESYYAEHRFADVFASLVRAPVALARRVAAVDGVAAVDHRVTEAVSLAMPGMAEPASGRVLSLPEQREGGLNRIFLKSGRWPEPDHEGEVLVGEAFAQAHGIRPGHRLESTLRGRRQTLTAVGIALSPEYLIQVQPGSVFPDDRRFGVFWMGRRQLAAASDMDGAFNDLTLALVKGASGDEVIRRVDRLLAPYGGSGAITRHNQISARFIKDELKGLRTMGLIPPAIFLGVAGFGIELIAVALALAAGALGVFGGVRTTVRLPPAAAMRPEAPADYRPSLLERLGLRRFLSQPARMVAREIGRRPLKAALTALGIACACAILVVDNFGKDAIDHLVDFQFGISERDDARVQFVGAPPPFAVKAHAVRIDWNARPPMAFPGPVTCRGDLSRVSLSISPSLPPASADDRPPGASVTSARRLGCQGAVGNAVNGVDPGENSETPGAA